MLNLYEKEQADMQAQLADSARGMDAINGDLSQAKQVLGELQKHHPRPRRLNLPLRWLRLAHYLPFRYWLAVSRGSLALRWQLFWMKMRFRFFRS